MNSGSTLGSSPRPSNGRGHPQFLSELSQPTCRLVQELRSGGYRDDQLLAIRPPELEPLRAILLRAKELN